MKYQVLNFKKEKVGEIDLPDSVFKVKWNPGLVRQVLVAQMANRREPWAHVKDRSEVRGGGRKPWRQKGTGRARHGSVRSPLWIGGGKSHGPTKERNYSEKVNKKMRRLAMMSVLSKKIKDKELEIFEHLAINPPKTKIAGHTLKPLLNLSKNIKKLDLLLIPDAENNQALSRASRNLPKTKVLNPESLNVYDLLNYKNIFVDQKAVNIISRHYRLRK